MGVLGYLKGPLGWAVIHDGKPIGRITRRGREYMVSIDGFRPGVDPATRGRHTFGSLGAAKAKAEAVVAGTAEDTTPDPIPSKAGP